MSRLMGRILDDMQGMVLPPRRLLHKLIEGSLSRFSLSLCLVRKGFVCVSVCSRLGTSTVTAVGWCRPPGRGKGRLGSLVLCGIVCIVEAKRCLN